MVLVQTWKPAALASLDAFDGLAEDALALHRDVVILLHAVQVDVEVEALVGGVNSFRRFLMNMPLVQR